jgi:hypothetical protein
MSVSSSGAITTTGVISGSNALSASYAINATSASYAATSSYASAFNVAGTLTATTLVVQTVTSSVIYSSGSNVFGNNIANTQTFTGSMNLTGSLTVVTTGTEFQVNATGVKFGNVSTDSHSITGSLLVSGSTHSIFGNVVLGNTSSINTSARLEVKGDLFLTPSSSASPIIHLYNRDSTNETYIYDSGSSSNSTLIFAPAGSTKMVVSSSGNVGIGTSSPTSKLHIINNTDSFVGRFTGGAASTVTAGIYANSTTGFASIGVQSTHSFRIFTSDADRLTVTSDGNVGIGITSPTQKFHIVGTTGLPATSGTSQNGTLRLQLSGYGTVLDFGGEGPATGKQWIQATDASSLGISYPLLLNPNGGIVGIGIISPTNTKLYVSATGVNQDVSAVEIAVSGSGTFQRGIRMLNGGMVAGESLLYMVGRNSVAKNTGQVYFYYAGNGSNSNRLSLGMYGVDDIVNITAAANVGIGTTNPAFKLDITSGSPDVLRVTNTGSATGNNPTAQFLNDYGDHSWGICAEFRVGANGGTDSSSILFSQGYNTNTWGVGFGYADTTYFRINKDQGPYGGGWGTTLFSMDRSGNYSFAGSNVSDRRNKKDITYIEDSQLPTILKLKPSSFNKKSPGKNEYSNHVHTGFIAQDVLEENIPNIVHGNEEEGYGLDYDGILALAVKAIQELKAEIDELKNK